MTEVHTNGHRPDLTGLSPADINARAEADARADPSLSGPELGRRYGRGERWGRRRAEAGRADTTARPGRAPADTTTRTAPVRRAPRPRTTGQTTRTPAPDLLDRWGRPLVGWAVTSIALVISYSHMRHLAELAGASWPTLVPFTVDGLMAAAVLCLRRHPRYWPARLGLAVGIVGALTLNGLAERPELVALADVRLAMAVLVPVTAAFGVHLVVKR
jgi:hypothetical protein